MLLGVSCNTVELLSPLPELLSKLDLSSLDLNKNITSELHALMPQETSIKKLLLSKSPHQIMVEKLLLLVILLTKLSQTVLLKEML